MIRIEELVERYGGTGTTSVGGVSSRLATAWRTRGIVVVGGRASCGPGLWTMQWRMSVREGPEPGGSLSNLPTAAIILARSHTRLVKTDRGEA